MCVCTSDLVERPECKDDMALYYIMLLGDLFLGSSIHCCTILVEFETYHVHTVRYYWNGSLTPCFGCDLRTPTLISVLFGYHVVRA